MSTMWRILGPVEVVSGGRALPIRRPQHRAVLAYLLLNADLVVSTGQLVEAVWGGRPPESARTQIQGSVSQIRRALREGGLADALASEPSGYRIAVAEGELDWARFTADANRARQALAGGAPDVAADLLLAALARWRGPALAGAAGTFVAGAAAELHERRLAGYEQLAAAELALDRYGPLAARLRPLVAAHPLRERLVAPLMLALAGNGQQAEALRLYAQTRARLAEELGVQPGPEVAAAHLRVLRQQVRTTVDSPSQRRPPIAVPAQLPADIAAFTGRAAPLRQLDALLPTTGGDPPPVVSI